MGERTLVGQPTGGLVDLAREVSGLDKADGANHAVPVNIYSVRRLP